MLRYPRRFLRAFAKTLYGYYVGLEIKMGILKDPNNVYNNVGLDYISKGINEYRSLAE